MEYVLAKQYTPWKPPKIKVDYKKKEKTGKPTKIKDPGKPEVPGEPTRPPRKTRPVGTDIERVGGPGKDVDRRTPPSDRPDPIWGDVERIFPPSIEGDRRVRHEGPPPRPTPVAPGRQFKALPPGEVHDLSGTRIEEPERRRQALADVVRGVQEEKASRGGSTTAKDTQGGTIHSGVLVPASTPLPSGIQDVTPRTSRTSEIRAIGPTAQDAHTGPLPRVDDTISLRPSRAGDTQTLPVTPDRGSENLSTAQADRAARTDNRPPSTGRSRQFTEAAGRVIHDAPRIAADARMGARLGAVAGAGTPLEAASVPLGTAAGAAYGVSRAVRGGKKATALPVGPKGQKTTQSRKGWETRRARARDSSMQAHPANFKIT